MDTDSTCSHHTDDLPIAQIRASTRHKYSPLSHTTFSQCIETLLSREGAYIRYITGKLFPVLLPSAIWENKNHKVP